MSMRSSFVYGYGFENEWEVWDVFCISDYNIK